ncbi:13512_t:CDS:2 [Gigaspora margarita]|uniref:13512_t:CDS:1 n=1 Tax=Gigaspora margarita TaxID=4874 RepID=A0ABN7UNM0_GIGMA|nr:13512_t:CDS:2 [Gigaspora margarita]
MDIIERIGPQKFTAIITESAVNLKSAKEKIYNKYPHILKLDHFTKLPQKLALLWQGLSNMRIHSEGLILWCPTCWGSLYNTTNSILLAQPLIKTCINVLGAGSANLADCYINIKKLAAIIYQIPEFNPFKPTVIQKCKELISQLRYYYANKKPFDLSYVQGLDTPIISPSQANCKRNFSTLKCFIGDKRTCLGIEKLEGMAKIRAYHMANIQSELTYFDAELTEFELCKMVKIATIDDYITDEKAICGNNDSDNIDAYEENSNLSCQTIILEDIRSHTFEFSANIADTNINVEDDVSMDYNPEDLVDTVLEIQ